LGVFSTLSGGLMILTPVVLSIGISSQGWRATWVMAAAVVALTVVPFAWFGLRGMPVGPTERVVDVDSIHESDASQHDVEFTRSEALRTWSFWSLAVVTSAAAMLSTALNFHQIDLLGQAGFLETAAAALFIPQIFGSTVAGLATGWTADRVGTRFLPAAGMALLLAAHWLGAIVAPGPIVFVYAIVLGAAGAAVRTAASVLLPAWYGTSNLGSIQGFLTFVNVGASALGPVSLAVAESGFGSYPPALVLLSLIPLAALLMSLRPDPRLQA